MPEPPELPDDAPASAPPIAGARFMHGLPFLEYCALPGLHFSTLKHMAISPLHYRYARDHERKDTAALLLGRVAHAMILTPDIPFAQAVPPERVVYDGIRRGKAWTAFKDENFGRVIVTANEVRAEEEAFKEANAAAEAMREAVWDHGPARDLISEGAGEISVTWSRHQAALRSRLDWLGPEGVVDLKTTSKIETTRFDREIVTRAYHIQLGMYADGVEAVTGEMNPPAWIIAVESSPPFDVVVRRIDRQAIEEGWRIVEGWIKRVVACEASGRWPGVGGYAPIDFALPDWAYAQGPEVTFGGLPLDEMGGGDGE